MALWASTSESGILRKNKPKSNHDDLLVFGYACKLFRDDEKATYIDHGKHLIPWMADDNLKIDRYDGRGALADLRHFEAGREGYDATRWLDLNEADRRLEQLCDRERYHALEANADAELDKEGAKRAKANEFGYNYDVPVQPTVEGPQKEPENEPEDVPYTPPTNLDVPVDISIPKTMKESQRIEKTALFVAQQGPQMEILIKAKQSNNQQFAFLNRDNELFKFYRHVLTAIKNGHYSIQTETKTEQIETSDDKTKDDSYLHPSLLVGGGAPPQLDLSVAPSIGGGFVYKPSANCAYSQLVNRIQGQSGHLIDDESKEVKAPSGLDLQQQQQWYQYYYAAQYYEYYKQMANYSQDGGHEKTAPPAGDLSNLDEQTQTYIQQMVYAQYQTNQLYNQTDQNPYSLQPTNNKNVLLNCKTTSILPLADYGSDTEYEDDEPPNGETKIVIDKMAVYVSKNGEQFEDSVKAKGDPRFEFLQKTHQFNAYYKMKLAELLKPLETKTIKCEVRRERKPIAPVSFSIKKTCKDVETKEIKRVLPIEESDDDDDNDDDENELKDEIVESIEGSPKLEQSEVAPKVTDEVTKVEQIPSKFDDPIEAKYDSDDPILEMIDLTADLVEVKEKMDAKRAEDRIRDKLAAAARCKMSKDLQMERKKKAAAFLKLKSVEVEEAKTQPIVVKQETVSGGDEETKKKVIEVDDGSSCDEIDRKKRKKLKKKSHKRKRSKSDTKSKKKSKRRHHRSNSQSSTNSKSSN